MSEFYKIIQVDNIKEIQEEIIGIFPSNFYGKAELFSIDNSAKVLLGLPKIKKLLDTLDISKGVDTFEFLVLPPGGRTGIHTDSDDFKYSFNIPLTDCDDTYLSFYKADNIADIGYVSYENPVTKEMIYYKPYNEDVCEFIESSIIKEPYIFNTDIVHNLENKSNKEQILALIRIYPNAEHAVKKYWL